jgi:hypothetical protein
MDWPELGDDAATLASELTANAILHAGTDAELRLEFHAHDTDAASACNANPCLTLVLLALRYRGHPHLPPDALQWPR